MMLTMLLLSEALACEPAGALWQTGQWQEAEVAARRCLDERPRDAQSSFHLSRALAGQGRQSEALQWATAARQAAPQDTDLIGWEIRLLVWSGEREAAWTAITALEDDALSDPVLARVAGEVAEQRGDLDEARRRYAAAAERWPDDVHIAARLDALDEAQSHWVATVRPERTLVMEGGDAWGLTGTLGAGVSDRLSLEGQVSHRSRVLGDVSVPDTTLSATARYQGTMLLDVTVGATPDADYSPLRFVQVEPGVVGERVELRLMGWQMTYTDSSAFLLSPAIIAYPERWTLSARAWRSWPSDDEPGLAAMGRAQRELPRGAVSVGAGGGNQPDYLRRDRADVDGYGLVMVGAIWQPSWQQQLRLDVTGRQEQAGADRYRELTVALGVQRRW